MDAAERAPDESPRSISLWLLVLLCALAPLSMDAMLPSIPALTKAMGAPPYLGQMVITTFLLGFAFGQLIWGPLSDKYGRRPILLAGLGTYTATVLVVLLMPEVWVVLSMRAVAGATACAGMVMAKALVMDAIPEERRVSAVGTIASALFLAPSLGPVAGGFLQSIFGWRGIFFALLILGVFLVAYILFRMPETLSKPDPDALKVSRILGNWATLIKDRHFRNPTLVVAFMSAGMFAFITGSPLVLMKEMGLSASSFGIAYMFVTAGFIAGSQIGVRMAKRIGGRRVVRGSVFLGIFGGAMMLALAWFPNLHLIDRMVWFIGGGFFFYVALGLTQPICMGAGLKDFPHIAGSASALQGFIQITVGTAASATVGLFGEDMIDGIGFFLAGAGVLSALTVAHLQRMEPPDDPAAPYIGGHVFSG